jgi:hypothetical protein
MTDNNATYLKLIDVIYGASSLNMTPEACSEQAHRIAQVILQKFDVSLKSSSGSSGIRETRVRHEQADYAEALRLIRKYMQPGDRLGQMFMRVAKALESRTDTSDDRGGK